MPGPAPHADGHPLTSRTALVLGVAVLLACGLSWVPKPWGEGQLLDVRPDFSGLGRGGPLPEEQAREEETVQAVALPPAGDTDVPQDARDEAVVGVIDALAQSLGPPVTPIERPCRREEEGVCVERAMDAFYAQLYEVARGTADEPAVWTQLGDSMTAWVAGPTRFRALLQEQFGDAGIGAFLPGDPGHARALQAVARTESGWSVRTAPFREDPAFGLNGAVFRGGRTTVVSPVPVDRAGVLAAGPGEATLVADTEHPLSLSTGLTTVDVRPTRRVTFDGFDEHTPITALLLERSGPGVRVDNLGVVSMRADQLLKTEDATWIAQARALDPHVLVFYYGAMTEHEDMAWHRRPPPDDWLAMYEARYARVLDRAARADVDCLVLSMLTRAEPDPSGNHFVVFDSVGPTVAAQRRAALAQGCAFFDSFAAMGGEQGADDWYWHEPRWLGFDLRHPTPAGFRRYGTLLYVAVIHGFRDWLADGGPERARALRDPRTEGP